MGTKQTPLLLVIVTASAWAVCTVSDVWGPLSSRVEFSLTADAVRGSFDETNLVVKFDASQSSVVPGSDEEYPTIEVRGPRLPLTFSLSNASQEALVVSEVATNCSCADVEMRSARLAPGSTVEVVLWYALPPNQLWTSNEHPFSVSADLVFTAPSGTVASTRHVSLEGTLKHPLSIGSRRTGVELVAQWPWASRVSTDLMIHSDLAELKIEGVVGGHPLIVCQPLARADCSTLWPRETSLVRCGGGFREPVPALCSEIRSSSDSQRCVNVTVAIDDPELFQKVSASQAVLSVRLTGPHGPFVVQLPVTVSLRWPLDISPPHLFLTEASAGQQYEESIRLSANVGCIRTVSVKVANESPDGIEFRVTEPVGDEETAAIDLVVEPLGYGMNRWTLLVQSEIELADGVVQNVSQELVVRCFVDSETTADPGQSEVVR